MIFDAAYDDAGYTDVRVLVVGPPGAGVMDIRRAIMVLYGDVGAETWPEDVVVAVPASAEGAGGEAGAEEPGGEPGGEASAEADAKQPESDTEPDAKPEPEPEPDAKPEPEPDPEQDAKPEPDTQTDPQTDKPEPDPQTDTEPDSQTDTDTEPDTDNDNDNDPQTKTQTDLDLTVDGTRFVFRFRELTHESQLSPAELADAATVVCVLPLASYDVPTPGQPAASLLETGMLLLGVVTSALGGRAPVQALFTTTEGGVDTRAAHVARFLPAAPPLDAPEDLMQWVVEECNPEDVDPIYAHLCVPRDPHHFQYVFDAMKDTVLRASLSMSGFMGGDAFVMEAGETVWKSQKHQAAGFGFNPLMLIFLPIECVLVALGGLLRWLMHPSVPELPDCSGRLAPVGRCLNAAVVRPLSRACDCVASSVCTPLADRVLAPMGRCLCARVLEPLGDGVGRGCSCFCRHVLEPLADGIGRACSCLCERVLDPCCTPLCEPLCSCLCTRVLEPLADFLGAFCTFLCERACPLLWLSCKALPGLLRDTVVACLVAAPMVAFLLPAFFTLLLIAPATTETDSAGVEARHAVLAQDSAAQKLGRGLQLLWRTLPVLALTMALPLWLGLDVLPDASESAATLWLGVQLLGVVALQALGAVRSAAAWANSRPPLAATKRATVDLRDVGTLIVLATLAVDAVQLAALPFKHQQDDEATPQWVSSIADAVFVLSIDAETAAYAAVGVVVLLVLLFSHQVGRELARFEQLKHLGFPSAARDFYFWSFVGAFLYGHGRPRNVPGWLALAAGVLSNTAFLWTTSKLVDVLVCDFASGRLAADTDVACWGGATAPALLAFAYYVPLSVMVQPVLARRLAERRTVVTVQLYTMLQTLLKCLLLVSAALTSDARVRTALVLLGALGLCLGTLAWTLRVPGEPVSVGAVARAKVAVFAVAAWAAACALAAADGTVLTPDETSVWLSAGFTAVLLAACAWHLLAPPAEATVADFAVVDLEAAELEPLHVGCTDGLLVAAHAPEQEEHRHLAVKQALAQNRLPPVLDVSLHDVAPAAWPRCNAGFYGLQICRCAGVNPATRMEDVVYGVAPAATRRLSPDVGHTVLFGLACAREAAEPFVARLVALTERLRAQDSVGVVAAHWRPVFPVTPVAALDRGALVAALYGALEEGRWDADAPARRHRPRAPPDAHVVWLGSGRYSAETERLGVLGVSVVASPDDGFDEDFPARFAARPAAAVSGLEGAVVGAAAFPALRGCAPAGSAPALVGLCRGDPASFAGLGGHAIELAAVPSAPPAEAQRLLHRVWAQETLREWQAKKRAREAQAQEEMLAGALAWGESRFASLSEDVVDDAADIEVAVGDRVDYRLRNGVWDTGVVSDVQPGRCATIDGAVVRVLSPHVLAPGGSHTAELVAARDASMDADIRAALEAVRDVPLAAVVLAGVPAGGEEWGESKSS